MLFYLWLRWTAVFNMVLHGLIFLALAFGSSDGNETYNDGLHFAILLLCVLLAVVCRIREKQIEMLENQEKILARLTAAQ